MPVLISPRLLFVMLVPWYPAGLDHSVLFSRQLLQRYPLPFSSSSYNELFPDERKVRKAGSCPLFPRERGGEGLLGSLPNRAALTSMLVTSVSMAQTMLQYTVCCFTSLNLLFLADVTVSWRLYPMVHKASTMLVIGILGAVSMEASGKPSSQ